MKRYLMSCGCRKITESDTPRCNEHHDGFPHRRQNMGGAGQVEIWDGESWRRSGQRDVYARSRATLDWARFTFEGGGSRKFWSIAPYDAVSDGEGRSYVVHYGRIGTRGQHRWKTFSSRSVMIDEARKMARSKRRKGYEAEGSQPGWLWPSSAAGVAIDPANITNVTISFDAPGGSASDAEEVRQQLRNRARTIARTGVIEGELAARSSMAARQFEAITRAAQLTGQSFDDMARAITTISIGSTQSPLEVAEGIADAQARGVPFEPPRQRAFLGICRDCRGRVREGDAHTRVQPGDELVCGRCVVGPVEPVAEMDLEEPRATSSITAGRFMTLEFDEDD